MGIPREATSAVLPAVALLASVIGCREGTGPLPPVTGAEAGVYRYVGRVDSTTAPGEVHLVGVASYVEFGFSGDSVAVVVSSEGGPDGYSFATVEIDGAYRGRFEIPEDEETRLAFVVDAGAQAEPHRLRLSQASEQWVGALRFLGASAKTLHPAPARRGRVSFFGDSISAGAASDTTGKSCDEEHYGDLANGFLAFPARAARLLDLDYVVHAQSGRGLYVNWNAEDPPLPALLDHLSMDTSDARAYDLATEDPILAVIALGTNDISDGEARAASPFDSSVYTMRYVGFADRLAEAYPRADFVLVTSPMTRGERGALLARSIARARDMIAERHPSREVVIADVTGMPNNGCSAVPHPTIDDQAAIAERVATAAREVL